MNDEIILSSVQNLDDIAFEKLVMGLLGKMGMEVTRFRSKTGLVEAEGTAVLPDGSVKRYYVHVKQGKEDVTPKELQKLVNRRIREEAETVFLTTGEFSTTGDDYGEEMEVKMADGNALARLLEKYDLAADLLRPDEAEEKKEDDVEQERFLPSVAELQDHMERGREYYDLKKYQKALDHFEAALELKPEYADAWRMKGRCIFELGSDEEALDLYKKALVLDVKNPELWFELAEILYEMGMNDDELECYDQAIKLNKHFSRAWNNKGATLFELNREDEAVECFTKAVESSPGFDEAWHNLGLVYKKKGKYKDAIKSYYKALALDGTYMDARMSLINVLNETQRYEESSDQCHIALRQNREDEKLWYLAAMAFKGLNMYNKAVACADNALEMTPSSDTLRRLKADLAFLQEKYGDDIPAEPLWDRDWDDEEEEEPDDALFAGKGDKRDMAELPVFSKELTGAKAYGRKKRSRKDKLQVRAPEVEKALKEKAERERRALDGLDDEDEEDEEELPLAKEKEDTPRPKRKAEPVIELEPVELEEQSPPSSEKLLREQDVVERVKPKEEPEPEPEEDEPESKPKPDEEELEVEDEPKPEEVHVSSKEVFASTDDEYEFIPPGFQQDKIPSSVAAADAGGFSVFLKEMNSILETEIKDRGPEPEPEEYHEADLPADFDGLVKAARLLYLLGRSSQALEACERALEIDEKDDSLWLLKGNALYHLGRIEGALDAYTRALRINPRSTEALLNREEAYHKGRYIEEKSHASKRITELLPGIWQGWALRGCDLMDEGEYDAAVEALEQASSIQTGLSLVNNMESLSLLLNNDTEEALDRFTEIVSSDPDNAPAWNNRGVGLVIRNQSGAEDAFNRAIKLLPPHALAWNNLGVSLYKDGQVERARESFDTSVLKDREEVYAHINRGLVMMGEGDAGGALESFEQAVWLDDDNHFANYNKGMALEALGDLDSAQDAVDRALELAPENTKYHAAQGRMSAEARKAPENRSKPEPAKAPEPEVESEVVEAEESPEPEVVEEDEVEPEPDVEEEEPESEPEEESEPELEEAEEEPESKPEEAEEEPKSEESEPGEEEMDDDLFAQGEHEEEESEDEESEDHMSLDQIAKEMGGPEEEPEPEPGAEPEEEPEPESEEPEIIEAVDDEIIEIVDAEIVDVDDGDDSDMKSFNLGEILENMSTAPPPPPESDSETNCPRCGIELSGKENVCPLCGEEL